MQFALTVPTVSDRVAQTAVKLLIEPILEPLFHADSYGYRPGKSARQANRGIRTANLVAARRVGVRKFPFLEMTPQSTPKCARVSPDRAPVMRCGAISPAS